MDDPKKHKPNDDGSVVAKGFNFFEKIPSDLESMILMRLPVESLLRSKCVCKSWLSVIESPDFISQHMHRVSDPDDNGLIIMHDSTPHGFAILPGFKQAVFAPEDQDVDEDELNQRSLASSFDGIVCIVFPKMVNGKTIQFASLWNPAMKQSVLLPPSPKSRIDESDCRKSYGFGLDIKQNAYKLVKFVVRCSAKSRKLKSLAVVYDLKTDSWKVLGDVVPRNFQVISNPKRPFQKSIYCWLGFDKIKQDYLILSYDFSNESFGIITLPKFKKKNNGLDPILTFLKEKIAFVNWVRDDSDNDQYHIWILVDYRIAEWTRLYMVTLDRARQPLGFSADGTLILLDEETYDDVGSDTLFFYNPLTEQGNIVDTPTYVRDVALYKESMVSVKTSLGLRKRTLYERLSKAVHDFQIFGNTKLPRVGDDVLQKEISILQKFVRDQETTIKKQQEDLGKGNGAIEKQKEDLSKVKNELARKNTQYKDLYHLYASHGSPPTSFPIPDSPEGDAGI